MEKILSIIIPTYNMEKYLRYCLDSLLINNNFDRLEILVINDGSKDSSSVIAHEYETRFPNVFKVIDKENGNYGSCINKGLSIATGKYVKVLDADDSFDTKNFEDFVSYLMSVDADLVLSDFVIVDENRNITSHREFGFPTKVLLPMSDICTTDSFKDMQMHAVTYRRQNLIDLGYKQTEGISYTDQQWIFSPMVRVSSVGVFDKFVYKYLVGRIGQTMDSNVTKKQISHFITCAIDNLIIYKSNKEYSIQPVNDYLSCRLITQIKSIYITCLTELSTNVSNSYLPAFDNSLKKLSKDLYYAVEETGWKINYIKFWRLCPIFNTYIIRLFFNIFIRVRGINKC